MLSAVTLTWRFYLWKLISKTRILINFNFLILLKISFFPLAIISTKNKLANVILIFQVDPKLQTALIAAAKENSHKVMEKKVGFISASLHKSFDGTSVVNYTQWETRKSYEDAINFLNSDEVKIGEKIFDIAVPDWNIYDLAFSAGSTPTTISVDSNLVTIINKFSVEAENQKRLLKPLDDLREVVEKLPGFISANVHRSLDGTRVVSYAQWNSKKEYQAVYTNSQTIPILDEIQKVSKFTWNVFEVIYCTR
jgi:heme-degrading monooxygenase HmoA